MHFVGRALEGYYVDRTESMWEDKTLEPILEPIHRQGVTPLDSIVTPLEYNIDILQWWGECDTEWLHMKHLIKTWDLL